MIDTLRIHFTARMFRSQKEFEDVGLRLKARILDFGGRIVFWIGDFERLKTENMIIGISKKRIAIYGSLWKFYKGYNSGDFWPHEVKPALDQLSRFVGMRVEKGIISEIHLAQNFEVDDYPSHYIRELQPPRKMSYNKQYPGETAWFGNKSDTQQIVVYDKTKEMIGDKDWRETEHTKNLIRYELRMKWTISDITGFCQKRVPVALLYSTSFWLKLVAIWYVRFLSLRWTTAPVYANIEGVRSWKRFCIASYVTKAGGISAVCALIDSFAENEEYQRKATMRNSVRNTLEEIMNDDSIVQHSSLSIELRGKVKERHNLLKEYILEKNPELLPKQAVTFVTNY